MAEDVSRIGGLSSGLAVILNAKDGREGSQKNLLISYYDEFAHQSVERTLEHIFDLPYKSIGPLASALDEGLVRSIIKDNFLKFHRKSDAVITDVDGRYNYSNDSGSYNVAIEESSICGGIQIIKRPMMVESDAMFSSARANVCVWTGKWMYEVTLETSGIQQLGWATLSCPFTNHMGVGDDEDSYAYDGRRVSKWNKNAETYGQSWVVGDVIGCCIDLNLNQISFYRNGISLGVAFYGIRKMGPGFGYYPAISLSQGERCDLNFGARPFKYPIEGFSPLQDPPSSNFVATKLLQCLSRLLEMQSLERYEFTSVEKLRRLKRYLPLEQLFHPISHGICEELFSTLEVDASSMEYIGWGSLLLFMMEIFRAQEPHDYLSLDKVVDLFLEFQGSRHLFEHLVSALSFGCKTASLVLTECPYSGCYPYLALACHILRREELMILWWKSSDFDFLFEGFLSMKTPNKRDLQYMMPSVCWPGSCEDMSYESSMVLSTTALGSAISKIEEKHRELCRSVIQFNPPTTSPKLPGSVFRNFLRSFLVKNRGADRNLPPPGVSSNSVFVSLYTVILHFLSEGFSLGEESCCIKANDVGFLHRGGQRNFPVDLFLKHDRPGNDVSRLGGSFSHLLKSHAVNDLGIEVIQWEEGCMDDEETRVTHLSSQKPCCCSDYVGDFMRNSKDPIKYSGRSFRGHVNTIPECSSHHSAGCSTGSLNEEIEDKPSSSDQPEPETAYQEVHRSRCLPKEIDLPSATLREEELLDTMLQLYHIGLAPNFKQASYYMSHQSQLMSLLEETDKQIRERTSSEQLKRLKEARSDYREEVADCIRHCAWYRIYLFSRWKQRGMYATCMWIVQLLLVLSKLDSLFIYAPEFYLETLVDCFHVLRKGDPPFVPTAILIKQGLMSFVTFVVTHFNDPRISSADLRDLLLQTISVLVQYKEFLAAFENNEAAIHNMPKALLSAFDNRSWIPVTNILLRLCKGPSFGSSKHGESSSSSSVVFQRLLREACMHDRELFSSFLNRLFNTLSWTMTEFSVSIREVQEKCQVLEFQQKKCGVILDLSCNLARVLEFCTREIPQAFLSGTDMNLRRLSELIVFILNHVTSTRDHEFFDLSVRRHSSSLEKVNRGTILAPMAAIIMNLLDARMATDYRVQNDVVGVFASMDCPDTVLCGFQYLLESNWADGNLAKIRQLEKFSSQLISRTQSLNSERNTCAGDVDNEEGNLCCICYACEADTQFHPCAHRSCFGCITRHLLNCQRCFFCNVIVLEVVSDDKNRS